MVLLEKLWDDVVAGPQPDRGLGKLRKITTSPLNVKGSLSLFLCLCTQDKLDFNLYAYINIGIIRCGRRREQQIPEIRVPAGYSGDSDNADDSIDADVSTT